MDKLNYYKSPNSSLRVELHKDDEYLSFIQISSADKRIFVGRDDLNGLGELLLELDKMPVRPNKEGGE